MAVKIATMMSATGMPMKKGDMDHHLMEGVKEISTIKDVHLLMTNEKLVMKLVFLQPPI